MRIQCTSGAIPTPDRRPSVDIPNSRKFQSRTLDQRATRDCSQRTYLAFSTFICLHLLTIRQDIDAYGNVHGMSYQYFVVRNMDRKEGNCSRHYDRRPKTRSITIRITTTTRLRGTLRVTNPRRPMSSSTSGTLHISPYPETEATSDASRTGPMTAETT